MVLYTNFKKKKDPCPGGGYRLKNTHFQYQVVTAKIKISTGPSLGWGGVVGEWFKACLLEFYGIGVKKVRKVLRMEGATCLRHKGTNRMVAWEMSLTLWLGFHSPANRTQIYISRQTAASVHWPPPHQSPTSKQCIR